MLKHPKEAFHSNFVSLDCDQGSMVTQHGKPMFTQVSNPAGCGTLKHLSLIPFFLKNILSCLPGRHNGKWPDKMAGKACCSIQQTFTELMHDSILGHGYIYHLISACPHQAYSR